MAALFNAIGEILNVYRKMGKKIKEIKLPSLFRGRGLIYIMNLKIGSDAGLPEQ
jgi:hypothetical protein